MPKTTYTDNTLATDPPGGKRHTIALDAADALPPEERSAAPKRRRAPAAKSAPARKSVARKAKTAHKAKTTKSRASRTSRRAS